MAKPLSEGQINALKRERGLAVVDEVQYCGLVQRGLLSYRWGNKLDHGYVFTPAGKQVLVDLGCW